MLDRMTSLDAIYNAESGPTFMTGIQALVRLPLMQRRLDRSLGLDTAGLISGYRGSPLGGYDQQLWKAQKHLAAHDVLFQPRLNEDLAATALWGAQMHRAYGDTLVDGVFGIWYGKGPGVDRSGDVFRAANMLGTSHLGGVLAVAGDDHAAQSSMYPHQTDGIFQSVMMPVLQPASVAEILTLGLAGIALSRFAGVWVAMKTIAEVVESAASFDLPPAYPQFRRAEGAVPPHGLNWDPRIAWPGERAEYERRMLEERQPAVIAWAALNRIDARVVVSERPRICFVSVGKAHQDLMQAFEDLELSNDDLRNLGVSIYKVAMSWPLDSSSLLRFADGVDTIFVVEEKQPIVEGQLKSALYHHPADRRPSVIGKTDSRGRPLLPPSMEFDALLIAREIVLQLRDTAAGERLAQRLAELGQRADPRKVLLFPPRKPFFCAGCPHNSSTKTPDGSIAGGGIGCHVMALSQPSLKTATFCQMGGEGLQWVGAAPFSKRGHIFQNLGDGTYQHSGLLAIRAAAAAGTAITFKILYNDAVAMTGGQPTEGALTPAAISQQLSAEGVKDIRLVTDDPGRWGARSGLASGVQVHHRDELDAVQRTLRSLSGVTAIIYEQTCAAEKRRRRKRKAFADPDRRLFINPRVCEGCGDCSDQSNCIAVEPLTTEFGTKRQINQASCNKDFSCVKGFCPSFVEVDGPIMRRPDATRIKRIEAEHLANLPMPTIPTIDGSYNVYVAGIGGLGVLTLGALLGTAAHLSGLEATVLDFTGLAQKNGAVVSQVRIAPAGQALHAVRIGPGSIDLMIATDSLVAAGAEGLGKIAQGKSAVVVNTDETPTADAVMDRDATLPTAAVIDHLTKLTGDQTFRLRASSLAQGLFGDALAANVMMLGFAWQQGLLPLALDAIEGAIRANGAATEMNLRAISWGRFAALDLTTAEEIAGLAPVRHAEPGTVEAMVVRRIEDLVAYQDRLYAQRYANLVGRAQAAAHPLGPEGEGFVRAVAANAYRLMAYKDEYEVARLYADPAFRRTFDATFSGARSLSVWLAPPILSRVDPRTGRPAKRKFGPWIFTAFAILAKFKHLRGTWADLFGYTEERRAERQLVERYFADVEALLPDLSSKTLAIATQIASLPAAIRGYGPVKEAAMAEAALTRARLRAELAGAGTSVRALPLRSAIR